MQNYDESKVYVRYALDVIDGKMPACRYIILACKRFLSFFERDDMFFDYEDVDRKINFVSKMKFYSQEYKGQNFNLLPFQQWIFANIFGFKWRKNEYRVTRNVFIFITRKNGKTMLAAALGIAMTMVDDEPGAEVDFLSNTKQQAMQLFEYTDKLCRSLDPKQKVFKRFRDSIKIPKNDSKLQVLCSDYTHLDGLNSSCFIVDELHAATNWKLYDVLRSSQGGRRQPLAIVITTAGYLIGDFPCYEYHNNCKDILEGKHKDDTTFSALYELDDEKEVYDESKWEKCIPALPYGVVKIDNIRDILNTAQTMKGQLAEVKTKHFNIFCSNDSDIWIEDEYIMKIMQPIDLQQLKGCFCYIGIDFSAVSDLTTWTALFPPDETRDYYPDKFIFKTFIYVPENTALHSKFKDMYSRWIGSSYVKMISGGVIPYNELLKDIELFMEDHECEGIFYDPYKAMGWAQAATEKNLPISEFRQNYRNYTPIVLDLELLIKTGKVIIDYNPCVKWNFSNTTLKKDLMNNSMPTKSKVKGNSSKIDSVITIMESYGGYMKLNNLQPQATAI